MTDVVILIPLPGGQALGLTREELATALARGRELAELGLGPNPAPASSPLAGQGVPRLVDSRELAAAVGVGDTTLEAMAAAGRIPCIRIGKALRFDPQEVLQALRQRHADFRSSTLAEVAEYRAEKPRATRKQPRLSTGGTRSV